MKTLIGTLFNSPNKRQSFTSPYATQVKSIRSQYFQFSVSLMILTRESLNDEFFSVKYLKGQPVSGFMVRRFRYS